MTVPEQPGDPSPCRPVSVRLAPVPAAPADAAASEALLDSDELARARRFLSPADRWLFVASHAHLRRTLSSFADVAPEDWRFEPGAHGRPEVARPAGQGLRFSLSHTLGLAACAVAMDLDVGVDVERVRPLPDREGMARLVLSPEERRWLSGLEPEERDEGFIELWVLKEACAKALGAGLALPWEALSFSLAGAAPRLQFLPPLSGAGADWSFLLSSPAPGYRLAVAVRARPGTVRFEILADSPARLAAPQP